MMTVAEKANKLMRKLMIEHDKLKAINVELVAALKSARELLSGFDGCSRNNFANLACEEVCEINAAIAKAESQS